MTAIKNLWPEDLLEGNDLTLPVTILREQAKYFNEMSKNILVATVKTINAPIANTNHSERKLRIVHTLNVSAPAMGYYDFDLIRLIQEQAVPYPLKVYAPLIDDTFEAYNDEELEQVLQKIFNDTKTISAVQGLISQSIQ